MRQPCGQQGGNNFRQELSGLSKTKAHSWFLHGAAVAQGLIFAIKWSRHQGYLAAAAEERALAILNPARISDTEGVRSRILRDGQIEASQARVRGQETD